uniref:Titin-cap n=1 Tax=Cairina moschata TaxID=8855 RepID=A0A8C3GGW8_CAIMO
MWGPSTVVRSGGLLSGARLGCRVKEEDVGRRETFSAEWLDLELSTRPEEGWCRREADERRRETLEQRGETRVLEQRSPWGVLRFGVLGQPLAQHLLPYARTLPLPLFAPPDLRGAKAGVPRTLSRSLSHEAQRDLAQLPPHLPSTPGPKRGTLEGGNWGN